MRYLALILAVLMSMSVADLEAVTSSKKNIKRVSSGSKRFEKKIKKKKVLAQQARKTINPDAFAPKVEEIPVVEEVVIIEEPAPEPIPAPVLVAEDKPEEYSTIGFLTSVLLTMHHLRGDDTFALPFKLTSNLGIGFEAELSWNFMKNAGMFVNGGLHTLKYKAPSGFTVDADSSMLYHGNIGMRFGQNYVFGGDIYYGFMQDLFYYTRNNTTGYLNRASSNLLGVKAVLNILRSSDYGLSYYAGGKYIFSGSKPGFEIKDAYTLDTGVDFKIGVTDTLFILTGIMFEYRNLKASTCDYKEYYGGLKLGFGRK